MRHRPYGKIAGAHEPLGDVPGGQWVALEKIHGAQLVLAVADGTVRFGKRKAWLADDDPFFGWQLVRAELGEVARTAAAAVGAAEVVLYGELFGGSYPHPDVAPVPGLQPVQTGIWYAPDLRWAPFDVLVATDADDAGELLAHHELVDLGLPLPPTVASGRRAQAEAAPARFPTRVPEQLGLPPIAGNLAEGIVVRPDARARPGARPIYKRKLEEFDERRFQESEAWDADQRPDLAALCGWAERLTNAARIDSAASKWGRHDHDTILDEVELDVLIDLAEAFPAVASSPREADEAALRATIRRTALALL